MNLHKKETIMTQSNNPFMKNSQHKARRSKRISNSSNENEIDYSVPSMVMFRSGHSAPVSVSDSVASIHSCGDEDYPTATTMMIGSVPNEPTMDMASHHFSTNVTLEDAGRGRPQTTTTTTTFRTTGVASCSLPQRRRPSSAKKLTVPISRTGHPSSLPKASSWFHTSGETSLPKDIRDVPRVTSVTGSSSSSLPSRTPGSLHNLHHGDQPTPTIKTFLETRTVDDDSNHNIARIASTVSSLAFMDNDDDTEEDSEEIDLQAAHYRKQLDGDDDQQEYCTLDEDDISDISSHCDSTMSGNEDTGHENQRRKRRHSWSSVRLLLQFRSQEHQEAPDNNNARRPGNGLGGLVRGRSWRSSTKSVSVHHSVPATGATRTSKQGLGKSSAPSSRLRRRATITVTASSSPPTTAALVEEPTNGPQPLVPEEKSCRRRSARRVCRRDSGNTGSSKSPLDVSKWFHRNQTSKKSNTTTMMMQTPKNHEATTKLQQGEEDLPEQPYLRAPPKRRRSFRRPSWLMQNPSQRQPRAST